ncbi:MAG: metal-dependent transcriptional regulator [Spirochaetia bacterium]|nr:metal-dependent transcriptional regulator [Spirochaetia bacterium]
MKKIEFHDRAQYNLEQILGRLYSILENKKKNTSVTFHELEKQVSENTNLSSFINELEKKNYIKISSNKIQLTKSGFKLGETIVRAYRIGMRFMADVLSLSHKNAQKAAGLIEHLIESETLDSLCTFLGHPGRSLSGEKIPPGSCCKRKLTSVKPVLLKLTDLSLSEKGVIKYIQNIDASLTHLGIIPGEVVTLIEKRPSVVINIGSTTLALDKHIAEDIYVKPDMKKNQTL